MADGVIETLILVGAGWFLWREAHKRGLVQIAPPQLPLGAMGAERDARPANAAPEGITNSTARAVAYARNAGVPSSDVELVAAIILTESNANHLAHNTNGEDSRGLMQVQLTTAQGLYDARAVTSIPRDQLGTRLFDPVDGVTLGYGFIKYLRKRIPAEFRTRDFEWVIRAYNGGEFWHNNGSTAAAMTANYFEKTTGNIARVRGYLKGGQ